MNGYRMVSMIKTLLFLFMGLISVAGCTSGLEKAIGNLKNDDPSIRYLAVGELQELDDGRTIPHLLTALHDEDSRVVRRAIAVLGERGDAQAIYPLIERLEDQNPLVWMSVSNALTKIGLPAVEPLISLLNHENPELVKRAAFILGAVGTRQAADPLMKLLRHPSIAVRMTAATALGRVKVIRSIPILIGALEDEDPRVQYEAAKALYQYRPYSIALLMESLESPSEDKVINAISILAKIGGEEVVNVLGALLNHSSDSIRMEAVKGLGKIGGEKTVEFLVNSLKDDFITVRNLAADYLVNIGSGSVELLAAVLEDEDVKLRQNAAVTLGRIGDQRAVVPLIDILSSKSDQDRQAAASALGGLGNPIAIQPLIEVLRSNNPELSWYATEALLKIGAPAIAPIIDVLRDKDPHMQLKANLMLLNLGTQAIAPLIEALRIKDKIIRESAEHLLLWIGLAVVDPLINVLNAEDFELSESAKKVLLKIGSRAVNALTMALENQPDAVRISVVRLLGEIGDYPAINSLVAALDDESISQEAIMALDKLNWRPMHWIDRIHYQIAKNETDVLLTQWDRTYSILRHQLTSGDKESIEYAVYALIELRDETIIPQLMEILKGQEDVSMAQWYASMAQGYVKPLIGTFRKESLTLHEAASKALVEIETAAVQPLIEALDDEDPSAWAVVMETLQRIGSAAVGPLEGALSHSSDSVRENAVTLLGQMGDKSVIPSLEKMLIDWKIRQQVALALDALGWTPQTPYDQVYYRVAKGHTEELQSEWDLTLETLVSDLLSGRIEQTKYAVWALFSVNKEKAIPELINILENAGTVLIAEAYIASEKEAMMKAAQRWALIHGHHDLINVEFLLAALEDEDAELAKNAALMLGRIGDERAVLPLIDILSNRSLAERKAAADALGMMRDPLAIQPLIDALKSNDTDLSLSAINALIKIGNPSAASLVDLFGEDAPELQVKSILALLNLKEQAAQPVIEALRSKEKRIHKTAEHILLWMGMSAVDPLINVLVEKDPEMHAAAKKVLLKIGLPGVDGLTTALKNQTDDIRVEIVGLLGEIGGNAAVSTLVAALDDERISQEAIVALDKLNWHPVHWIDRIHYQIAKKETDTLLAQWDQTYGVLKNQLASGDKGSIEYAVYALIELKGEAIIPQLMEMLKGQEDVSMAQGYVKPLIGTFRKESLTLHEAASKALVEIETAAVQPLIEALDDEDPSAWAVVMETLQRIGSAAVGPLEGALSHSSDSVRENAVTLLGQMGDKSVIPSLEKMLIDWKIRQQVALALDALGWTPQTPYDQVYYRVAKGHTEELQSEWDLTLETLVSDLLSGRIEQTKYAVWALFSVNKEKAIPELINILENAGTVLMAEAYIASENQAMMKAAQRWALIHGHHDLINAEFLLTALEDEDIELVKNVALTLGRIEDERAVLPLIDILSNRSLAERKAAADALGMLCDPLAIPSLIDALKSNDTDLSASATEALITIGTPTVAPLIDLLGDESPELQVKLILTLLNLGEEATRPLIEALRSKEKRIRKTAEHILLWIGLSAIHSLIDDLDDKDKTMREAAAVTLEKMGPIVVKPLEKALNHPSHLIRTTAATLLGRSGQKSAVQALKSAFLDWKIRQQVALALDALGWTPQTPYDQVYYRVAKGHTEELQREWDLTLETLIRDLRSRRKMQTEYAVLALLSVNPETAIPKLKALLAHEGDITLAKAYYASGNSPLIIAALDWTINNGYFETILNQ